jgi:hypothetical protein
MLGYVDQLLISSFVRRIIPIFFLHTQGKNCTCAAVVERWRIATLCRQQHCSVWNDLLLHNRSFDSTKPKKVTYALKC